MRRILFTCLLGVLSAGWAFARTDGSSLHKSSHGSNAATTAASNSNTVAQPKKETVTASGKIEDPNAEISNVQSEMHQLRELIALQSKELTATQEQIKQQQTKIDALERQLEGSNGSAGKGVQLKISSPSSIESSSLSAEAPVPGGESKRNSFSESSSLAPAANGAKTAPAAGGQVSNETTPESPLQFKIGSAYITPVGFMDLTGVWRSTDVGSGIGTNFAGIPYGGAGTFQANEHELRFSMQNSRIGFRVDANVKGAHVIGYMEADFLGNAPNNLAVSSNSNTLRSRLYWVDVRKGAWEILGGQTWSLATPNRVGVSPMPGDIFFSDNMDTNYQVGDVWGRIAEFRVAYHFANDKGAFAVALDSPDQYMGGTNGSVGVTLPSCCSYYAGGELDNGSSALNPPNKAPDIIAKLALDPSKRLHFEVGGIARFFQLYNQTTATHFSATGGAGFVNLDFGLTKELRLLTHNYWSDGGGRYVFGQAPDLAIRADGSPSLMHSGSTVDGIEFTHSNTTVFGYYGLVYIPRNVQIDTSGCPVGWGFAPVTGCAGPSSGDNRSIQEGTVGFANNFWKSAKYGALSLIGQYSYVNRDPWYVAAGQPNNAHVNMLFWDLRYTLPGSAPTLGKPGKE